MKLLFKFKDPKQIIAAFNKVLEGHELQKNIAFKLADHKIVVTISKLGTSILTFAVEENAKGIKCVLESEKIALAHRTFKKEVTKSITDFTTEIGGSIEA